MEEEQCGMAADLRQFISGRSFSFYPPPPPSEFLATHRSFTPSHPFEMLVAPRESDCTNSAAVATVNDRIVAAGGGFGGFGVETVGGGGGGGDGCAGRWPRQETLTLLEIRSRLDAKFKEANQKGPLWDEVSRILSAEHGYQRSGKKCREKFENLYKYYKKTKEGKAGRQDGKHYRFFRQLEALYGESTANSASVSETHFHGNNYNDSLDDNNRESCPAVKKLISETTTSVSLSHDSDETNSSSDDSGKKKRKAGKRSWKAKITDFIDSKMKRLFDKQEVWTEKMMRTMEHKERERMVREEEWRRQDAARIESEHEFWAKERAWMEARDATLIEALQKLTGNEELIKTATTPPEEAVTAPGIGSQSFNQNGDAIVLWNDISSKMGCFGHDRSGSMRKNKWDSVSFHLRSNKKRKDQNSKINSDYQNSTIDQEISDYSYQGGRGYSDTSEQAAGIDHASVRTYSNVNGGNATIRYFTNTDHASYGRILD